MVSIYDTTIISLIINYSDMSAFCQYGIRNTTYDTPTVTNLKQRDTTWSSHAFRQTDVYMPAAAVITTNDNG